MAGKEGREHKIVISRFPADVGILAEESERALTVEFLERVFMKRATTYKAAAYQHTSLAAGFWLGRAVDKQINSDMVQLSNYWIAEFLDSDFRTTAAAGTKRLAVALRDAARKTGDVTVKREIAAAVTLGQSLDGQRLTIKEFSKSIWPLTRRSGRGRGRDQESNGARRAFSVRRQGIRKAGALSLDRVEYRRHPNGRRRSIR